MKRSTKTSTKTAVVHFTKTPCAGDWAKVACGKTHLAAGSFTSGIDGVTCPKCRAAAVPVAEICMYGTHETGAGYLARADGRMFGTGEPVEGRTFTTAMFCAFDDLQRAGVLEGLCAVFEPGGRVAYLDLGKAHPYFGDLRWELAPVYTLSAETIIAAGA